MNLATHYEKCLQNSIYNHLQFLRMNSAETGNTFPQPLTKCMDLYKSEYTLIINTLIRIKTYLPITKKGCMSTSCFILNLVHELLYATTDLI